jgi:hypothetical protein
VNRLPNIAKESIQITWFQAAAHLLYFCHGHICDQVPDESPVGRIRKPERESGQVKIEFDLTRLLRPWGVRSCAPNRIEANCPKQLWKFSRRGRGFGIVVVLESRNELNPERPYRFRRLDLGAHIREFIEGSRTPSLARHLLIVASDGNRHFLNQILTR